MRCSERAGSRAARAVAPRGGFRAAGRTRTATPLTSLAGGQAGQGCNRLTGKQGLGAEGTQVQGGAQVVLAGLWASWRHELRRPYFPAQQIGGAVAVQRPGPQGPTLACTRPATAFGRVGTFGPEYGLHLRITIARGRW